MADRCRCKSWHYGCSMGLGMKLQVASMLSTVSCRTSMHS